mmetsp:Transcript_18910/g.52079  ORF Transcript_18910/g.52079 Transcript_18910/m.52079 type:complete len:254 (-) Transcript_18910:157-918(-)
MHGTLGAAISCSTSGSSTFATGSRHCRTCCCAAARAPTTSCSVASTPAAGTDPACSKGRSTRTAWVTPRSLQISALALGARPASAASTARPSGSCTWAGATVRCCRSSAAACACPSGASPRPPRPTARPRCWARTSSASSASTSGTWTATRCHPTRGPSRGSSMRPECSARSATRAGPRPRWTSWTASSCCRWPRRMSGAQRSRASCSVSARASSAITCRSCTMRPPRAPSTQRRCGRGCGSCSPSSPPTPTA